MTATPPHTATPAPRTAPRHPLTAAMRESRPGVLYQSRVTRHAVQRDDGAGPLSRLISLAPDGLVGYTLVFDEDTRAHLDALYRPARVAQAKILILGVLLGAVPDYHKRGHFSLRYGCGHGWHIHGLLDARAVTTLTTLPGWDLVISPLDTVDDVKRWAGYCVKHTRSTRGPEWSWQRDAVQERLLRDDLDCATHALARTPMVQWFGLPDRRTWTATPAAPEPKPVPTPRRTRPVPKRPPQPTPPVVHAHDQGEALHAPVPPSRATETHPPA